MAFEPDRDRWWYERDWMVGRRHRVWRWALGIGFVLVLGGLGWLAIPNFDRRSTTPFTRGDEFGEPADAAGTMDNPRGAVGTSGGPEGVGGGQAASGQPILRLETITDQRDGRHLVGRPVNLRTVMVDPANDVAFWVGTGDDRVLVVPDRDTRSGVERQMGLPSHPRAGWVGGEQLLTITGVIEPIPYGEATYSWNLTRPDVADLIKRMIYVRAFEIRPAGAER